jgi:hypothetical protein
MEELEESEMERKGNILKVRGGKERRRADVVEENNKDQKKLLVT